MKLDNIILGYILCLADTNMDNVFRMDRKRENVYARHLAFYVLKKYYKLCLEDIGEQFPVPKKDYKEGLDHATVFYGLRTLENLRFSDNKVKKDLSDLDNFVCDRLQIVKGKINLKKIIKSWEHQIADEDKEYFETKEKKYSEDEVLSLLNYVNKNKIFL